MEKLAGKLGIADKVRFLGNVQNEKIPGHLAGADVFVRPSRSEGLGSAFLEAMAAEVPIIGTAVGGIPDFLKDGETGIFCETENPKDLAKKIELVLNDEVLKNKMVGKAKRLIEQKYNWDAIAQEMKKVYDQTLYNHSGL